MDSGESGQFIISGLACGRASYDDRPPVAFVIDRCQSDPHHTKLLIGGAIFMVRTERNSHWLAFRTRPYYLFEYADIACWAQPDYDLDSYWITAVLWRIYNS